MSLSDPVNLRQIVTHLVVFSWYPFERDVGATATNVFSKLDCLLVVRKVETACGFPLLAHLVDDQSAVATADDLLIAGDEAVNNGFEALAERVVLRYVVGHLRAGANDAVIGGQQVSEVVKSVTEGCRAAWVLGAAGAIEVKGVNGRKTHCL